MTANLSGDRYGWPTSGTARPWPPESPSWSASPVRSGPVPVTIAAAEKSAAEYAGALSEFGALGTEFNNMSERLERRLALDRPALLQLALGTAMDAVSADAGRLSSCSAPDHPLVETDRKGSLAGLESDIYEAERVVLGTGELGASSSEDGPVLSVALRPFAAAERVHGVIMVARRETAVQRRRPRAPALAGLAGRAGDRERRAAPSGAAPSGHRRAHASSAGDKEELIAETDVALYVAKRSGKNRIVQAGAQTTNVVGAE